MAALWKPIFLLSLLPGLLCAEDWPQWRGPNRDGISRETGLLKSWPESGPRRVWKATGLGEGYSGVAVAQGRIYTLGQQGDQEFVVALDARNGRKLWQTPAGKAFRERRGNGPRSTPTVEGERLWALSADGTLVCLETASGKRIWSANIVEKFGGEVPHWGVSESPLIDGETLMVMPGGSRAGVVALRKTDGSLIWKSQSDRAGYSSAIVADLGGVRQVVALSGERAMGLRTDNGELLWQYDKVSNRTANIATPIFHQGHVFLSTDYGTGGALLKLSAREPRASEVYFSREMKNHYCTSVLVGETLYGYSSRILTAMDFRTGDVLWRDRSVGKGSLVSAEGMLYCFSEDGVVGLVKATPEGYREVSGFTISRGEYPTWTPPVISDGRLYLRDQDALYSYDIKVPGSSTR